MKISLEYIAKTEQVFSNRDDRELKTFGNLLDEFKSPLTSSFYLVLSTDLSREILLSKSFLSYDYFSSGIQKLIGKGNRSFIGEFFQYAPIFQEGDQHQAQRKKLFKMLDNLNEQLTREQNNLDEFIMKRASKIKSPLDFSKNITIFCLSFMITQLLNISSSKAKKSILLRSNVWRPYFHPKKQFNLEKSLATLNTKFISEIDNEEEKLKILLAQSLIIMGYDPLVATICASASKKDLSISFAQDSLRTCPTSYVTRICNEDVTLKNTKFKKGSIITLSLLPTSSERENITENTIGTKSLSYGLGNHICIGKKNSFVILGMAENIWVKFRNRMPASNLKIAPDGAFLAYK
jgi:cytochrome P450